MVLMVKVYVNNAFSLKMLQNFGSCMVECTEVDEAEFRSALKSADEVVVGHPDTAKYFGVPCNRKTVHLEQGDVLFVCEANSADGGRLPSGTEFLSQMGDGVYFRFLKVVRK